MPKKDFAPGDLVKLKSGGPVMAVKAVHGYDSILCQWFGGKKLESGHFHSDSLEVAKAEEK